MMPSSLIMYSLCDLAKEEAITVTIPHRDPLSHQAQSVTSAIGSILKLSGGTKDISNDPGLALQEGKLEMGGRRQ